MNRRPPRSNRTDPPFPYPTLFRSFYRGGHRDRHVDVQYGQSFARVRKWLRRPRLCVVECRRAGDQAPSDPRTRRFARASEAGTQIYTAASGRQLAARPSGMGHHCGGADGILDSLWGRIQQFTERTSRMTALATNSKIWLTPRWRSLARYLTLFVAVLAVSILLTDPAHAQAADGVTSMAENIKTWLTGTFAKTIAVIARSEEHTSELQSLMRISYAVFCLKKKKDK